MIPIHRQIPAWRLCLRGPEAGLSIRHSKIEPRDLLSPQITSYREANYVKVSRDALLEAELFSDPTCSPASPQQAARTQRESEQGGSAPAASQRRVSLSCPFGVSGFTCGHRFSPAAAPPSWRTREPVPARGLAVHARAQNTSGRPASSPSHLDFPCLPISFIYIFFLCRTGYIYFNFPWYRA